jgi:hypothetical protein
MSMGPRTCEPRRDQSDYSVKVSQDNADPITRRGLIVVGAKGAAAGLVVALATLLIMRAAYDCHGDSWECLGVALKALSGALLLAPVLAWIVLWALRIEWAFAVAMCGTLITLLLNVVAPVPLSSPTIVLPMMVAMAAIGYGTSAVTLSTLPKPWLRGIHVTGLALFVIAVVLFAIVLSQWA